MTKRSYTEAPFDQDGNLLSYPVAWKYGTEVVWKPIEPFTTELELVGTQRGRSAAHFIWRDAQGREYPMFLSDMTDLLKRYMVSYGRTPLTQWTIKKRGQNYGIALHD